MITKYEQYYNKINEISIEIQKENFYPNKSVAFGHWFLRSMYDYTDQEISESIIDGGDDFGVDAVICDEENKKLSIFQFKFPKNNKTLNKEIGQSEILKTLNGFDILKGSKNITGNNKKFEEIKKRLKGIFIEKFEIVFVSFNNGIESNKNLLEGFKGNFERESGSIMEITYIDKRILSNLFEKLTRTTTVKADIPYKMCQQAYSTKGINSYVGVLDAYDLVESIQDKMLTIFDENIRLLEEKSQVNDKIKMTAADGQVANMFYFYNNGIVLICDKASNSPNSLTLSLEGASIVNGCQTVNSLFEVFNEDKLSKDVSILFRVIEISDYDERSQITTYLNSQNSIKGSYFIANHSIVRDLQDDLLKRGYYLERQKNERKYKTSFGENIDSKLITIRLDDMIQYYAGYWYNNLAAIAKRGKGMLFETSYINEILSDINVDKVIESFDMYNKISKVITSYRKVRRNEENTEFSEYIGIDQQSLIADIDDYLFMNTADILLLNISKNLKDKYKVTDEKFDDKKLIVESILLAKNKIKPHLEHSAPATLTKKNEIFEETRENLS